MILFLHQFGPGQGDYTAECQQRLDQLSLGDSFTEIEYHRDAQ